MAIKIPALKSSMTKTETFSCIAENTGLTKKQIASVFETLEAIISRHVKTASVGIFTLPGLLKIKAVKRPARPAQKHVPNPFKPGEFMDVAARPASMKIKSLPLKRLKDMVK